MADEKKIFLAYVYRSLNILYTYLYKMDGHHTIDGIVGHHEDQQACYAYIPATPLGSLALHKFGADKLSQQYGYRALPKIQSQFMEKLIHYQLPTVGEAIQAGIINVKIDKYNPLFSSLLTNL